MNIRERFANRALRKEFIMAYGQIMLGCLIGGAAYPLFLMPNNIAPGGLSGLAMIINYLFGAPVGTTSLLLNVPLFILGWKAMGRVFVFRSLLATFLFSMSIDLLKFQPLTMDPLLGTLFGGILLGAGLGLILRGGATTGGTDMAARMVHKRFPFITVGGFLLLLDCAVVAAAAVAMGASEALYALICIYVSSKVVDMVLEGMSSNKACFIITDQYERVTQRILVEMERGVTYLSARGAYTGRERPVVLCVVSRMEVARIKDIVREADERAFVFITEAHEALGEGFSRLSAED
ncbi:MAG: YitT family protein [Clostridia bacterium]|nr:YitT family protein [Clostridia bacterium]